MGTMRVHRWATMSIAGWPRWAYWEMYEDRVATGHAALAGSAPISVIAALATSAMDRRRVMPRRRLRRATGSGAMDRDAGAASDASKANGLLLSAGTPRWGHGEPKLRSRGPTGTCRGRDGCAGHGPTTRGARSAHL